jgi:hypothetical protein
MRMKGLYAVRLCKLFLIMVSGALFWSAPRDAHAQDAASARAFLNSIFQLYPNNGIGTPYSSRYIHSSLLALIHADLKAAEAAKETPGPLDGDIVCDCQEWDGVWVHKIDVKIVKPGRAIVTASFDIRGPENRDAIDLRIMRYTLVPERGQWRIYDIQDLSPWEDAEVHLPLRKGILKEVQIFRGESK